MKSFKKKSGKRNRPVEFVNNGRIQIIGGEYRSRVIRVNKRIKSTTSRVVESLFDILSGDIKGRTFFDCFGGSGRVGIEAVSRGASESVIVEQDFQLFNMISENIKLFNSSIFPFMGDVLDFLNNYKDFRIFNRHLPQSFDYIYVDPPYADLSKYFEIIEIVLKQELLSLQGMIILEHNRNLELNTGLLECFSLDKRRYGNTYLTFLRLNDS